jgi:hypothetical protein
LFPLIAEVEEMSVLIPERLPFILSFSQHPFAGGSTQSLPSAWLKLELLGFKKSLSRSGIPDGLGKLALLRRPPNRMSGDDVRTRLLGTSILFLSSVIRDPTSVEFELAWFLEEVGPGLYEILPAAT